MQANLHLSSGLDNQTRVEPAIAANTKEIPLITNDLLEAITNLEQNIECLRDQLNPVLRRVPPSVNDFPEITASTDLGSLLNMFISRTRSANSLIADIRERLEL